jgi:hypothetical protein
MKKRKPPILLGAMLLILVGAAAVISAGGNPLSAFGGHDHSQDQKPYESKEAEEQRKLATRAAELSGMKRTTNIQLGTGDSHFVEGQPLLIFPPTKIYRPKPTETETSTQWFTDESATDEERKKAAAKK